MKAKRTIAGPSILLFALSSALSQPVITQQPTNQSVSLGANVTFRVAATGAAPLSYQWRFDALDLLSATNRSLSLTNVQLPNAGDYAVVVANSSGSVTSQVAHLDVDPTFTKITAGSIVNDVAASLFCAWGDYDNDGFLDLLVINTVDVKNFLYHNNRDGTFTRVTAGAIANDIKDWSSAAWADYDNDGNLDVLIASQDDSSDAGDNATQAVLYRNNGGGTFTRMPAKTIGGLVRAGAGFSLGPDWADYDNDGFLDLFMARIAGIDWLYHNDGNGAFTSITNNLVGTAAESSFDAAWADYNNDGRPDLFVAVFSEPATNRLYLNLGGGSFAQVTSGSIATDSEHSYDPAWADYDNDGYLDLFVAARVEGRENNMLYHNDGGGTFTRMTSDIVGSIASDLATFGRCAWGDYDNDGFIDLIVTHDELGEGPDMNLLYHNNGDGSFTRIFTGSLVNDAGDEAGCAWGDYDNDGFLDLFVLKGFRGPEKNYLYRNNGNKNNWLKVKCVGTVSNRSAIGAKVRAKSTIGGKTFWQLREIGTGSGINKNPLEAHFGLGDATNVDTLRIEWPSGIVQEFHDLPAKQFLTITEPPRLLAQTTGGVPQFSLKGGRGFQYQMEASTDLVAWSSLGTLTITNLNGIAQITDTSALGSNRRFYRAVSR